MTETISSKNFTYEKFEPKETKNKKIVRKTLRIRRQKGKMTYADIKQIYEDMIDKKKLVAEKVAICGMTEKYLTLKSFEEDDLKPWDDDEYYQDRAKDSKKFNEYDFIDLIIKN